MGQWINQDELNSIVFIPKLEELLLLKTKNDWQETYILSLINKYFWWKKFKPDERPDLEKYGFLDEEVKFIKSIDEWLKEFVEEKTKL